MLVYRYMSTNTQ